MLLTLTPANESGWRERGACFGSYSGVFFPERGESTKAARVICDECVVVQECSDFAVGENQRFGVWGSTTERERVKIRKDKANGEKKVP